MSYIGKDKLVKIYRTVILLSALATLPVQAAVRVTPEEMVQKDRWVQENLLTAGNLPPFSFTYGAISSSQLLAAWTRTETDTVLDSNRTQHVITWANNTLQVKCVSVDYGDSPMVEWTVYFKNIGTANTPILQDIQGLDITITRTNEPEFVLHGNQGSSTTFDAFETFQPWQLKLDTNSNNVFSPPAGFGRPTWGSWPYYNLQTPDGGLILAIGWPGQWASSFIRDAGNGLRIEAGQQLTHLYLKSGEEIRTPLITLMFWMGSDIVRSQNLWRHWYLAHVIPKVDGQLPATILQVQGDSSNIVDSYLKVGIQPDMLWRDAGWYPDSEGPYVAPDQWLNTGTWEINTNLYPSGFRPTSVAVHALGAKFLLWFEPERVGNTNNSWLVLNHPEWLLHPGSVGWILNEGNPQVFDWLTNHFSELIKSNGVDWYREDLNGNGPLPTWQNNDTSNRQGITENFYVQGHLAYWDALLQLNPGLRIDAAASGRADIETLRRAVLLGRTDLFGEYNRFGTNIVEGNQCETYGLASWIPFYGSASLFRDPYSFRSFYMPSFGMVFGPVSDHTLAQKQAYTECQKVAPIMLNGDYYPLTGYSQANNVWMGWQFDWADKGVGCVQIFRRTNSLVGSKTFKLEGLDAGKLYDIHDFDKGDLGAYTGSELMSNGLTVQLDPRGSAILIYTNLQGITISAAASPNGGFKSLTVQFTATGSSITGTPLAYKWTFGDGGSSTNQNPVHTYRSSGRFLAEVTASDSAGNTNSKEIPITVMIPAGWKMKTTFAGYSKAETLTNFPMLVVFGTNLSRNGFSYSQLASSNGWDLVFMDSGGKQALNYEIEKWNTNGESYVWVQVPELNSSSYIWTYWGNTNLALIPQPSLSNGSVWANGYSGIWHLANGVVLSGIDSTANGHDAAVRNAVPTNGVIDGAVKFNGANSYLDAGTESNRLQSTMSAWINPVGGLVVMMKGSDNISKSYGLEWSGNSSLLFTFANTPKWLSDGGSSPSGQWSYVTGVIDGTNTYIYVNGVLKNSDVLTGTLSTTDALPLWLGAQNRSSFNYWYNGILDEARLSTVARSPDWIWAEYMNMASNGVFSNYGQVISNVAPVLSTFLTPRYDDGNVVMSWPTNCAGSTILQTSVNLVNWTDSTATVTVSGTNNTVTVEPKYLVQFYRLVFF